MPRPAESRTHQTHLPAGGSSIAPFRALAYDILAQAEGHNPSPTPAQAALRLEIRRVLDHPHRDYVADERACQKVLRRVWQLVLANGWRHDRFPGPEPKGAPENVALWHRLCALFDTEYEPETPANEREDDDALDWPDHDL